MSKALFANAQKRFLFQASQLQMRSGYVTPMLSARTADFMQNTVSKRDFSIITNGDGGSGADGSEAAAKASAKEFLKAVDEDLIIDEITS